MTSFFVLQIFHGFWYERARGFKFRKSFRQIKIRSCPPRDVIRRRDSLLQVEHARDEAEEAVHGNEHDQNLSLFA